MRTRLLALAIAALAAGCPKDPKESPKPPTNLTVTEAGFDAVFINWVEPGGSVDGYELDANAAGGPWQRLNEELIPRGVTGGYVSVDPSVAELIDLGFRIRSVHQGTRSSWSPITHFLRGIRPPSIVSATATDSSDPFFPIHFPPVTVAWENASLVATELVVERTLGPWPSDLYLPLDVSFGATSFVDTTVTEGTWQYRVRYGKGGVWSSPSLGASATIDLVPPSGLTAVQEDAGIRLAWTNGSTAATQEVYRQDPGASGWGMGLATTLPIGATSWLESAASQWPGVRYQVRAVTTLGGPSAFTNVAVLGSTIVDGPVTMVGTPTRVQCGDSYNGVARTDEGRLHLFGQGFGSCTLCRDLGGSWEAHVLTGGVYPAMPAILADENGNPHAVYYAGYPRWLTTPLVHEWYDGAAWQSEQVLLAPDEGAKFGLGPGNTVHVLVGRLLDESGTTVLNHYARTTTGYVERPIVATTLPKGGVGYSRWGAGMAVGADGTAWIVESYLPQPYTGEWTYVLHRRTPDGTWSEELVPFAGETEATVLGGSGAVAGLVYDSAAMGSSINFRLRTTTGWGAEEVLPVAIEGGTLGKMALSSDGRAAALFSAYPTGTALALRTAEGWQTMTLGAPSAWAAWPHFDADGRITAVVLHSSSTPADISAFVERPPAP